MKFVGVLLAFVVACGKPAAQPSPVTEPEARAFITEFMEAMKADRALGPFLAAPADKINSMPFQIFEFVSVKPPDVEIRVGVKNPTDWRHVLRFKVVRGSGGLRLQPSDARPNGMVDPWQADAYVREGHALVFYLLDSEGQAVGAESARYVCKHLDGVSDFIADSDPNLSVVDTKRFLAEDLSKVARKPGLADDAARELQELKSWIEASPKPVVGFQIERRK